MGTLPVCQPVAPENLTRSAFSGGCIRVAVHDEACVIIDIIIINK